MAKPFHDAYLHPNDDRAKPVKSYIRLKWQVHLLLDPTDGGTFWDKVVNSIIVMLILANLLA